ncbi:hypothetical protein AC579_4485 [Pseudocercospora musae]|uniref:Uncharacterized protein n=1 Tax=Pseudocercospora musae TaxID=113226 RepID=A0A139GXL2_9PEZI|nr:hypothetical protein AC579_4485 [Pseudocercospora musae]
MLDHERDEWQVDTTRLKNGLQNQPQKELLNHFNATNFSNRLRRYQARVIGSLHAYLRDNSAAPFQLDRTSLVDVLLVAAKLLRCFDREGLDTRVYEDLMEHMWAFFQVDPELADKIDPSGRKHRANAGNLS